MVTKVFKSDKRIKIVIGIGNPHQWTKVFVDDIMIADVVSEEEARRVVWLGLVTQGQSIDFVSDDMFEEVDSEV